MDNQTIFDRILSGEIPCYRVYEDEHVLAFMDLYPLAPGHTLIIPKHHASDVHELPDEAFAAVGRVVPRIARAVAKATDAPGYNLHVSNGACAGQVIWHVHLHVIPRAAGDGLGYRWNSGSYREGEMAAWRDKITNALEQGG